MLRYLLPLTLAAAVTPVAVHAQAAETPGSEEARVKQVLAAIDAINAKKATDALTLVAPALAEYEKLYVAGAAVRCTHDESQLGSKRGGATLISNGYCYALWAKGFALVELERMGEAVAPLERAAALMPDNAQFQSELGYVHQVLKHWPESNTAYAAGASAAEGMEDETDRKRELRRAWFGLGYNMIELGKLEEAEAYLNKALTVAPGDQKILGELQFIKEQRAKKTS